MAGFAFAAVCGCGGGSPKYVPVSGIVTVNGKPYPNAVVSFQPKGSKENPNPGQGSAAFTDANGRFVLKTRDNQNGAVVGKHQVRIQTRRDNTTGEFNKETGSPDQGPRVAAKPPIDPIGVEWYGSDSNKEFDVPPSGTDQANFDIVSTKK